MHNGYITPYGDMRPPEYFQRVVRVDNDFDPIRARNQGRLIGVFLGVFVTYVVACAVEIAIVKDWRESRLLQNMDNVMNAMGAVGSIFAFYDLVKNR
jgi:hypothetical protein